MREQSLSDALLSPGPGISESRNSQSVHANARSQIVSALARLDAWIEAENFQGWDPHDALNSPLLVWVGKQRLAGIVAVQLLRRCPVNLRPLLGIRKGFNPKAMGLFLETYAQKFAATRQEKHLEYTRYFFSWLVEHVSSGHTGPCWGYNFDWPNRDFFAPAGTPTVVNTGFIGLAVLSAEATLGSLGARLGATEQKLCRTTDGLTIARGACDFILHDLHTLHPTENELCFSYTPIDHRFIHNANLLGAWLLAAVYAWTAEKCLAKAALAAARFTARRQRADGSWPYGITSRNSWVDNFHTGYVLVALKRIATHLRTDEFDAVVRSGYRFWKKQMLENELIPKYYSDHTLPIDIHSVAQAILTYLEFSDLDPEALDRAWRIAFWGICNMQDSNGFFYYQLHRGYRIRVPYMRWSQAWMQRALTGLVNKREVSVSGDDGNANLD